MGDVPHDADVQTLEVAPVLPYRIQVEKGLGGMLVLAVSRVDDGHPGKVGDLARDPGMRVAHDDQVDLVGAKRFHRVGKALALHRGGGASAEVQAVGGKALLG